MFRIIHGNRLEGLADRLLADASSHKNAAREDTEVLQPETLIVPSLGMTRWLKARIALCDGVCANVQRAYLAEFIWRSFSALLPDVPARSRFDPDVIAWRLFERLGALPQIPEYGPLAAYVALTRARNRCFLCFGRINEAECSPLAWLLFGTENGALPADLEIEERFRALSAAAHGHIRVEDRPAPVPRRALVAPLGWPLPARRLERPVPAPERVISFTSLHRAGYEPPRPCRGRG